MQDILGVIDIHSHGVSGALLAPTSSRPGSQICREATLVHHEDIALGAGENFELMLNQLVEALRRTASAVRRASGRQKIIGHCFLSSPFYIDRTKIIRWRHGEPRWFTPRSVSAIINREAEKFVSAQAALGRNLGSAVDDHYRLAEKRLLRLKLNGYEVPSTGRGLASEAEIAMYFCLVPSVILNRFEIILQGEHWRSLSFHPFSFVLYRLARLIFPKELNLVLVNVEEEITEVAIMTSGVLLETFSFPFGTNHLIRRYATVFQTVPAEAESALRLYFADQQTAVVAQKIKKFFQQEADSWRKPFYENLDQSLDQFLLSPEIRVIATNPFGGVFVDWLTRASEDSGLVVNSTKLHPESLDERWLAGYCGDGLNPPSDLRLVLGGIFCDKIKS